MNNNEVDNYFENFDPYSEHVSYEIVLHATYSSLVDVYTIVLLYIPLETFSILYTPYVNKCFQLFVYSLMKKLL